MHAAGSSGDEWVQQRLAFGWQHEISTPDLPGHGRSTAAPLRSIEAMAEWLRTHHALAGAVLVGHSMGAAVAIAAAARESPRGLVLMGAGPRLRVPEGFVEEVGRDARVASRRLATRGFAMAARAAMVERASAFMTRTDPAVLAADFQAGLAFDAMPLLGAVGAPTLVLVGAEDRMTTLADAETIASGIPGAELRVIEGAGHMLMLERPRETNAALAAFVERLT